MFAPYLIQLIKITVYRTIISKSNRNARTLKFLKVLLLVSIFLFDFDYKFIELFANDLRR